MNIAIIAINVSHDANTGEWAFVAEFPGLSYEETPTWKTLRWPDCETWWQFVRAWNPDIADQLRGEEVRREFGSYVTSIQERCRCLDCAQAVASRAGLAHMALTRAARQDRESSFGAELVPVPSSFVTAGDDLYRAMTWARGVRDSPGDSYNYARKCYMETGTIDDKDAMLSCVTKAEPDLETLGRDWEPAPQKLTATIEIGRRPADSDRGPYPALFLTLCSGGMLWVGVMASFVSGLAAGIPVIASAMLGLAGAIWIRR